MISYGPRFTRWRIFFIPQRFKRQRGTGVTVPGIPKKKIIGLKPKRVIARLRPKRPLRRINNFLNPPIGTFVTTTGSSFNNSVAQPGTNTYSVVSGYIPPGLTLNTTTGAITGVPTTAGTFPFTIQSVGTTTGVAPYTIIVNTSSSGGFLPARPCS